MSELREQRWSVLSERGCEASGVNYDEAAEYVRRLRESKVHGLCIVSVEAARRIDSNNNGATDQPASKVTHPPAKKSATAQQRRKNAKLS
jgi:hypothetical protein